MSTKKALDKALAGEIVPQGVYLPPVVMGGKQVVTSWEGLDKFTPPTLDQQRIRINVECDPVGQLMAIANGLPIASFEVVMEKNEEGEEVPTTKIRYETADLKTRIKLLEAMRDKVVPNLGVNSKPPGKEDDDGFGDLAQRRGAQILAEPSR